MIRFLKAAGPALLLGLAGCTTPFKADVSRFGAPPVPAGQTFFVVPADPRLDGSLEFANYANVVAQDMQRFGYRAAAAPTDAQLIVKLDYGVGPGREKIRSYPSFGRFGGGFGYGGLGGGFGPYSPYFGYGYRPYVYGYNDPFLFGTTYDDVESFTVYESQARLMIERAGTRERLFEGTAKAMSTDNDLTTLVPNLVDALFTGFPGNSGQTVRITLGPKGARIDPRRR